MRPGLRGHPLSDSKSETGFVLRCNLYFVRVIQWFFLKQIDLREPDFSQFDILEF